MDSKMIWLGMFVGSTAGSFVPTFWGADMLSMSSIIWSAVGGFLGVWLGFKLSHY